MASNSTQKAFEKLGLFVNLLVALTLCAMIALQAFIDRREAVAQAYRDVSNLTICLPSTRDRRWPRSIWD